MKRYHVAFSDQFEDDLARYRQLLVGHVTDERSRAIIRAIVSFCRNLETAPLRGTDWGNGYRTLPALGRGTILFRVDETALTVTIIGWWWRGAPAASMVARH